MEIVKTENPEKNDVVILELDRPRPLRLTHRVLKRYLAATGIKMTEIDQSVEDYGNMTLLIYEMLRADDPELTPEKCDELLDLAPLGTILQKGADAIAAGFGEPVQPEGQQEGQTGHPLPRGK